MATTALVSGNNVLVQNQVYATPGLAKWCVGNAALEVATTVGASFVAVAASTTGFVLGGGLFLRCPGGAAVVVLSNQ